ncbi:C39 family peptidase, partial [Patescibacteria group bacterium]|nr:C39 family peptidase [Patescibacteria group bacterium]
MNKNKIITVLSVFFLTLVSIPISGFVVFSFANATGLVLYEDTFSDNQILPPLKVSGYVHEDGGSFTDISELDIAETEDEIKIQGTGKIDVMIVDSQEVGWIGKSLALEPEFSLQPLSVESTIRIESNLNSTYTHNGFQAHLFMEFDSNNRIMFSIGDTGYRFSELVFDEEDTVKCIGTSPQDCPNIPFDFENGQNIPLKLEFNPYTNHVKAYIDGQQVNEGIYGGNKGDIHVGLATSVRNIGDEVDARFDDFKVTNPNILNVPSLKQYDEPWGPLEYDSAENWFPTDPSIARWGCALTSACMVLQYHGHNVDPKILNTWLKSQNDGYTRNGSLNWLAVSRYTKNVSTAGSNLEFKRYQASDSRLNDEIHEGRPPILKVPGHFIVGKGITESDFFVNDPASATRSLLSKVESAYGGSYSQIYSYVPSETDLSYIMLVVDEDFNIEVASPGGGLIQDAIYTEGPIIPEGSDPEDPSLETLNVFLYPYPDKNPGDYVISITGDGEYQLDSYLYDNVGDVTVDSHTDAVTPEGEDSYLIHFDNDVQAILPTSIPEAFQSLIGLLDDALFNELLLRDGVYVSTKKLVENSLRLYNEDNIFASKVLLGVVQEKIAKF